MTHVVVESHGLTHANEVSGRDDVATDEDVIGNAAESKSPALTSPPSDQLHPSLLEDCNQLGNVVKYSTQSVNLRIITIVFLNT